MGFGGISIWQLLIVLAIIVLLFGTKKLKGMGADIGGAVKGFKKAINNDADETLDKADTPEGDSATVEKVNTAEDKK